MVDRPPTLFVIDCDAAAQCKLAGLADSLGLAYQAFPSAEVFLAWIVAGREGCVLADLQTGGISGVELVTRLTELDPDLPVVLRAGDADIATVIRAVRRGAYTVLEEACPVEQLAQTLREAAEANRRAREARRRRDAMRQQVFRLDPRERCVMDHIVHGLPNKVIAKELGISQRTVDRIRAALYKKLAADSPLALARLFEEVQRNEHLPGLPPSGPHGAAGATQGSAAPPLPGSLDPR